jgi:hypothetical protein
LLQAVIFPQEKAKKTDGGKPDRGSAPFIDLT